MQQTFPAALILSLILSACGGGSNSGDGSTPPPTPPVTDLVPPSARIVFPTLMSYTDASSSVVRGNANDAHAISAVNVNGVPATSTDGFQTWQATVPIVTGDNSLAVNVTDTAGNIASSAATASVINNGPANYAAAGLDYDATGDRVLTADNALNAIYYYGTGDGIAHILAPAPGPVNGLYASRISRSTRHTFTVSWSSSPPARLHPCSSPIADWDH